MPTVTAIAPASRRRGHVEVEIDGEPLGVLPEAEVARLGLAVGSTLDEQTLLAARDRADLARALGLANGFLAHRPRSEAEVRARLQRAGLSEATLDAAIGALAAQGLLDDRRFAALWVESRTQFSPRSARALGLELRRKGVDRQDIEEVLAESGGDETATAVAAGRARLRSFSSLDEEAFRRRMGGFLARRGFGYETVRAAVDALWGEAAP